MPPHCRWWRFISFKKINSTFSVLNKFIADIIFFVYGTFAILKFYTLIVCTSPLYIWIVITIMSKLIGCYDYKAGLIYLLIMKHTHIYLLLGYIGAEILKGSISIMC